MCLCDFFKGLLTIAEVEDTPTFERSRISNQAELTNMILSSAEYLDDETILKKLPFLTADEIEGILERKDADEMERFEEEDDDLSEESADLDNKYLGEFSDDVLSMLEKLAKEV